MDKQYDDYIDEVFVYYSIGNKNDLNLTIKFLDILHDLKLKFWFTFIRDEWKENLNQLVNVLIENESESDHFVDVNDCNVKKVLDLYGIEVKEDKFRVNKSVDCFYLDTFNDLLNNKNASYEKAKIVVFAFIKDNFNSDIVYSLREQAEKDKKTILSVSLEDTDNNFYTKLKNLDFLHKDNFDFSFYLADYLADYVLTDAKKYSSFCECIQKILKKQIVSSLFHIKFKK